MSTESTTQKPKHNDRTTRALEVLLALMLLALVPVIFALVSELKESSATAPVASTSLTVKPAPEPEPDVEALMAEYAEPGVMLAYSDDPEINCGVTASISRGGCFRTDMPHTIFLSSNLHGETLSFMLLHELAHAHQYHNGLLLDECGANALAIAWGANPDVADRTIHRC